MRFNFVSHSKNSVPRFKICTTILYSFWLLFSSRPDFFFSSRSDFFSLVVPASHLYSFWLLFSSRSDFFSRVVLASFLYWFRLPFCIHSGFSSILVPACLQGDLMGNSAQKFSVLLTLALAVISASLLNAQDAASLTGTVTDASSAVV